MTLGLTELGPQKCLDEVPGREGSNGTSAHANNVHVVVLDPLPGRVVVVHQPGTDSRYLVCTDRRSDAAAADGYAAFDRPCRHSPGERDDEVGIVVARIQLLGAEVDDLVPGGCFGL